MKNALKIADSLRHSSDKDVAEVCQAFLALQVSYDELEKSYIRICGEKIMLKYAKLFKKLAENGD